MTTGLILAFLGSALAFVVSMLVFKAPALRRHGEIDVANVFSSHAPHRVYYGVEFASPPQLSFNQQDAPTYLIRHQSTHGFDVEVSGRNSGSQLKWVAEGVPKKGSDTRARWSRMNLGERVSLVTGSLAGIGLVADLLGIFDFFSRVFE